MAHRIHKLYTDKDSNAILMCFIQAYKGAVLHSSRYVCIQSHTKHGNQNLQTPRAIYIRRCPLTIYHSNFFIKARKKLNHISREMFLHWIAALSSITWRLVFGYLNKVIVGDCTHPDTGMPRGVDIKYPYGLLCMDYSTRDMAANMNDRQLANGHKRHWSYNEIQLI